MKDCCLNCKYFKIWDDDPCCLEPNEWKIVFPSMVCEKFKEETFKPVLKLHKEMWDECKQKFFKTFTIDSQVLIDDYLKMFPEDKDIVEKTPNKGVS